jgi:hypothetical protein
LAALNPHRRRETRADHQGDRTFLEPYPERWRRGHACVQMVGTHAAAMECLRRAMISDQLRQSIEGHLRSAQKLLALYTLQVEGLNRHRGKGQQKVTVEYVNVEPGARAIVGSVEPITLSRPQPTEGQGHVRDRRHGAPDVQSSQTPFRGEDCPIRFNSCETHLGKRQKSKRKQCYKRFGPLKIRFPDLAAAP